MIGIIELAVLLPFVLWSVNEQQKQNKVNQQQDLAIQELHHAIDNLSVSMEHHIKTSEIRLDATAHIVDKIWSKLE